ncbi:MAG TPA: hypothetical protein VGH54_29745, partial [Mycobacterium sp.]
MSSDETASAFMARVRDAQNVLLAAMPAKDYSLATLVEELGVYTLLRGTPYTALATSLLAQDTLSIGKVEDAIKNEELRVTGASQVAAASVAAHSRFPTSSAASPDLHCTFCGLSGSHVVENCFKFKEASQEAQNKTKAKKKGKGRANAAKEVDPQPTESAGAASTRSSPSNTSVSDFWNADTGATSHMTPRRDWFKDYRPSQVLIRVANHEIVRAAGIGSVEFLPVKQGLVLSPIVFTNVLHVPALAENLLSVLTITRKHRFQVLIDADTMHFMRSNQTLFTASVGENNVAL